MSLHPTADRLTELDASIRADTAERSVLLQLLAKLQALTSAMPTPLRTPYPASALTYGYSGSVGGYTGINAFLLK